MAQVEQTTAEEEHRFHCYTTSTVPWSVHLYWLLFWGFSTYYVLKFLLPVLSTELQSPP